MENIIDLHQIELQILQLLGIVIGSAIVFLLQKALAWMGLKLKADRQAQLISAVDKMMTLGVTKADEVIRENGWDHVASKSAVLNFAMPAIEDKFSHTLADVGIDPSNAEDRVRLWEVMERMWPDVASRLSASPATPPAPVVPAVVTMPPV